MALKIGKRKDRKDSPMNPIDSKKIEEAFASLGKAVKELGDNLTAQGVFGLTMTNKKAVPGRLTEIDPELLARIQEAAVDLTLMTARELNRRAA